MVLGAGWAGARAMTSTSGPGISLMGEFAGLAYYAEVPGVVFDIQRVGPSTGLPTRTAQGDILSTALLSHGDTKQIMLIPATVEECYSMAMDAFDLAERFQTLVFVMSDLDLGMNTWMSPTFPYPDKPLDRGKRARRRDAQAARRVGPLQGRRRRRHPVPHHSRRIGMPPYFTRGSGHNEKAQYSERPDDYVNNIDRLARKFETARQARPEAGRRGRRRRGDRHHRLRHAATGRSTRAATSSRARPGIKTGYMRLRAYPFTDELDAFIDRYERIYVVEQNRDAQMLTLLRLELSAERIAKLRSVLHLQRAADRRALAHRRHPGAGRRQAGRLAPPRDHGGRGRRTGRIERLSALGSRL